MKSYKQLDVWQKAVNLAIQSYRLTGLFPQSEKFGLTSQIRKAVTSIPANIAEGWGRGSTGEYVQFLFIARASLMELETHLIISRKLDYMTQEDFDGLISRIEEVGRMLNGLVQALKKKRNGSGS